MNDTRGDRRGVSEVFSAILVMMLVMSVGIALYLGIFSGLMGGITTTQQQLIKEDVASKMDVELVLVYANTTNVTLYFYGSSFGGEVYTVYINDTSIGGDIDLQVRPHTLVKTTVPIPPSLTPSPGDLLVVKVIYPWGEEIATITVES